MGSSSSLLGLSTTNGKEGELLYPPKIMDLHYGKVYEQRDSVDMEYHRKDYFYHPNIESLDSHSSMRKGHFFTIVEGPLKDRHKYLYTTDSGISTLDISQTKHT